MLRVRFQAYPPVSPTPLKHPYWITGFTDDGQYAIFVSYADGLNKDEALDYIYANWPEATNIEYEQAHNYVFTSRFPKPEWFKG